MAFPSENRMELTLKYSVKATNFHLQLKNDKQPTAGGSFGMVWLVESQKILMASITIPRACRGEVLIWADEIPVSDDEIPYVGWLPSGYD